VKVYVIKEPPIPLGKMGNPSLDHLTFVLERTSKEKKNGLQKKMKNAHMYLVLEVGYWVVRSWTIESPKRCYSKRPEEDEGKTSFKILASFESY
jgi:hypothetical protein